MLLEHEIQRYNSREGSAKAFPYMNTCRKEAPRLNVDLNSDSSQSKNSIMRNNWSDRLLNDCFADCRGLFYQMYCFRMMHKTVHLRHDTPGSTLALCRIPFRASSRAGADKKYQHL